MHEQYVFSYLHTFSYVKLFFKTFARKSSNVQHLLNIFYQLVYENLMPEMNKINKIKLGGEGQRARFGDKVCHCSRSRVHFWKKMKAFRPL